jgi:hypothetical protein
LGQGSLEPRLGPVTAISRHARAVAQADTARPA